MAFCDWLTIYQDHFNVELPRINNGAVFCVDADGQVIWTTEAKLEHVGSYDTKIRIKCDGSRVSMDGNLSRFNRADNVFGRSVIDCVLVANAILKTYGLPPFTHPRFNTNTGVMDGGAIITRADITENYQAGSNAKAIKLLHYLAGHDSGRRASVKQYGANGCSWNEGSKYWYAKAYLKAESLGETASSALTDWVKNQGIVRHEISLKSRYLSQNNLRHITDWTPKKGQSMENIIYGRFTDVLNRGTACRTPLENLPKQLAHLALAWQSGKDLWSDENYGQSTRRRWRRALLQYGIDIKQPSNVSRIPLRVEILELEKCEAPAWYWNQHRAVA